MISARSPGAPGRDLTRRGTGLGWSKGWHPGPWGAWGLLSKRQAGSESGLEW